MYYEHLDGQGYPITGSSYMVYSDEYLVNTDMKTANVGHEVTGVKVYSEFSSPEDMLNACQYAEEHFARPWIIGLRVSIFRTEADAALFKLMWRS